MHLPRPTTRLAPPLHSSLEPLEARIAPATFTVTTTDDSGAGSLRQAILDANAAVGLDAILFNIPNKIIATIHVMSPLPLITSPVLLNGASQPGVIGQPKIEIFGDKVLPLGTDGLVLSGHGADGSTINGIAIIGFPGDGLEINGSDFNTVTTSTFGVTLQGKIANGGCGIFLTNANHNTLGGFDSAGLVVSGNGGGLRLGGIELQGSSDNKILGSKIGTDMAGLKAIPNGYAGIGINSNNSDTGLNSDNVIGVPGAGNLISGNNGSGIVITRAASTTLQGNIIGLAADGKTNLHNSGVGISLTSVPTGGATNTIGGTISGQRNVISGNSAGGISIHGNNSTQALSIQGNLIGADKDGNVVPASGNTKNSGTGNLLFGIQADRAWFLTIGGTVDGARNVISGNGTTTTEVGTTLKEFGGVVLYQCTNCVVAGNFIGLDGSGLKAAGNLNDGLRVDGGSKITIGGNMPGARNFISGNGLPTNTAFTSFRNGITITGDANAITISGNFIGTDANGTKALGNYLDGIAIGSLNATSSSNVVIIGGATGQPGNVISGNGGFGIDVGALGINSGSFISNTQIGNNFIGTDVTGQKALPNGGGILLTTQSIGAKVGFIQNGNQQVFARNVISGNTGVGLSASGTNHVIKNNFIGTDMSGAKALGNGSYGVILGAQGFLTKEIQLLNNIVSANGSAQSPAAGISLSGTGHIVTGNTIGLNLERTASLGNAGAGILITGSGSSATIGGTEFGSRNVIGGNGGDGITVNAPNSKAISIRGNHLGGVYDAAGYLTRAFPNGGNGIRVTAAGAKQPAIQSNFISNSGADGIALGAVIGADVKSNFVFSNGGFGVSLRNTVDAFIHGNTVGFRTSTKEPTPNALGGISLVNSTAVIGAPGEEGNVITGNSGPGIHLQDCPAGVVIQNNGIGNDLASATEATANSGAGIEVLNSPGVIIGGDYTRGNVIAGNQLGILFQDTTTGFVRGNRIGFLFDLPPAPGNAGPGILVQNSQGLVIGGPAYGARNYISGNGTGSEFAADENGGIVLDLSSDCLIAGNYIGTDADGVVAKGNHGAGVRVNGGQGNMIGGDTPETRNVIAANFGGGIVVSVDASVTIQGNYIGTDYSGKKVLGNYGSGIEVNTRHLLVPEGPGSVMIGGPETSQGNVISGNGTHGISVNPPDAATAGEPSGVQIGNNFIGTDATGLTALGNARDGIHLSANASVVRVGRLLSSSNEEISARNVISGNGENGVAVQGKSHLIADNYIGVDATGSGALGNSLAGVTISGNTSLDYVKLFGNVISANGFGSATGSPGVLISANAYATDNTIGLNADRTAALGNAGAGIVLTGTFFSVDIGSSVGDGSVTNVIAGNGGDGILIDATEQNFTEIGSNRIGNFGGTDFPNGGAGIHVVANGFYSITTSRNHIGGNTGAGVLVDGEGSATLNGDEIFGNGGDGVSIAGNAHASIHGTEIHDNRGAGVSIAGKAITILDENRIAANARQGVNVESSATLFRNTITGNSGAGVSVDGIGSIVLRENDIFANAREGIHVVSSAPDHVVQIDSNTIHDNTLAGVGLDPNGFATITLNAIFGNGGLAIDLGNDGPTPNDALDADTGANDLQNSAALRSAFLRYGSTLLRGSFDGAPNRDLRVEFYTYSLDELGHEIGSSLLDQTTIHTDAGGQANLSLDAVQLLPGQRIGATVTDLGTGFTSEFSSITTATPPNVFATGTGRGTTGLAELVAVDGTSAGVVVSVVPYGPKFRGGVNVTHADVDHDGLDDLITSPGSGRQPIHVYSGFDMSQLASWSATPPHFTGGVAVAAGDTDGDGRPEILTALGQGAGPRVSIHDALTGTVTSSFLAFSATSRTGVNLTAGDLDGDGRADIVASTASGRAVVHAFAADGTSLSPVIHPFANALSFGAQTAIYHATPDAPPLLAIGSGAGVRPTIAFYDLAGKIALPNLRLANTASNAPLSLTTVPHPLSTGDFVDMLVTAIASSRFLQIRPDLLAPPTTAQTFAIPPHVSVTLG